MQQAASPLRLLCVSTALSPWVAWRRRSRLRLYFKLHTSYFILYTSYFILHTSYFYRYNDYLDI